MLIYALVDPRNNQIRYIGKTMRTAHRRLRRHLARCYLDEANTHKNRWLRQLLAFGLEPQILVLETCTSAIDLSAAERRHIAAYRTSGARLTNATPGGDGGGWKHTPESREKLRRAHTGKKKSAEHLASLRASQIGRITSEETRVKLRAAHRARKRQPWSDERRIAISRGKGGRPFTDQHGNIYQTQKDAARRLGINIGHLNEVLHGTRSHTSGYVFQFVQEFPS